MLTLMSNVTLANSRKWKRPVRSSDPAVVEAMTEARRSREEADLLRATNERIRSEFEARITRLEKQLEIAQQQLAEVKSSVKQAGESKGGSQIAEVARNEMEKPLESEAEPAEPDLESRVDLLEERVEVAHARLKEHAQTRVETGEKFGVRLFGLLLLNAAYNSSGVQDTTLGIFALPRAVRGVDLNPSFNATLKQTILGLAFKGPQFGSAKLSGDIAFDLFGGNPPVYNGSTSNIFRLRTASLRLDFKRGAIVAGQEVPVISPLNPTSFASVGIPALSDSGNLWSWTPQVKGEYELIRREKGTLLVEAAALAPLSGFEPDLFKFFTEAGFGERSRMPAFEARIAFTRGPREKTNYLGSLGGSEDHFQAGLGVHYGRQKVLERTIDSVTLAGDLIVPITSKFTLSGEFFWGRALAGLGGGIQQGLVLPRYGTKIIGVRSIGGWAELKYRPYRLLEINVAYGADDPYEEDLRGTTFSVFGGGSRSLNRTASMNAIYHYRSNMFFAAEYRYNQTFYTRARANQNNHFNLAIGYKF
jgi:hypothetical protein